MSIIAKHNEVVQKADRLLRELDAMKEEITNELIHSESYEEMMDKFNSLGPSMTKLDVLDELIQRGLVILNNE